MTSQPNTSRDRWNDIVVPTAKGFEKFFWNLAWFAVIVALLFGGPCLNRSTQHGGRHDEQRGADSAGQAGLPDLQHETEVRER